MKKYIALVLYPIGLILIITLICSIINMFGIEINKILLLLLITFSMITCGYILGNYINSKYLIKGIIYGISISLSMFLLSFIFKCEHSILNLLYYLIITTACLLGTIVNTLKKNK